MLICVLTVGATPPLKEFDPESVVEPVVASEKLPPEMLPVKTPCTVLLADSVMLPPNVPEPKV